MGQKAQTGRTSPRGYITIDWMVLVVGCIALLALLATTLRSSGDAEGSATARFQELGRDDTLLTFQDFTFSADGWTPSSTSDQLPGLGPILGPFGPDPVQRSFAIPTNTVSAHMTFDLHLLGDWGSEGAFHVMLDDAEVLTVRLPDADADAVSVDAADVDGVTVAAHPTRVSPRTAEPLSPGANTDFVTLRVRLAATQPAETLTLRLLGEGGDNARWSLDNLTVVATRAEREEP